MCYNYYIQVITTIYNITVCNKQHQHGKNLRQKIHLVILRSLTPEKSAPGPRVRGPGLQNVYPGAGRRQRGPGH